MILLLSISLFFFCLIRFRLIFVYKHFRLSQKISRIQWNVHQIYPGSGDFELDLPGSRKEGAAVPPPLSIPPRSLKFMFTLTSAKNVSSVYYPSREFYSCHEATGAHEIFLIKRRARTTRQLSLLSLSLFLSPPTANNKHFRLDENSIVR